MIEPLIKFLNYIRIKILQEFQGPNDIKQSQLDLIRDKLNCVKILQKIQDYNCYYIKQPDQLSLDKNKIHLPNHHIRLPKRAKTFEHKTKSFLTVLQTRESHPRNVRQKQQIIASLIREQHVP